MYEIVICVATYADKLNVRQIKPSIMSSGVKEAREEAERILRSKELRYEYEEKLRHIVLAQIYELNNEGKKSSLNSYILPVFPAQPEYPIVVDRYFILKTSKKQWTSGMTLTDAIPIPKHYVELPRDTSWV